MVYKKFFFNILGLENNFEVVDNEIEIENGFCETLTTNCLDHCPFEKGINLRENNT